MVLKILLEIFLFLLVVAVAYIVVVFIVCKDITGTWNGFRFLFDYKYWSFAILNHEYNISLDRDEDYSKFVVYFSKKQLMPRTKGVIQRMREKERKILVMLLSQENFVKENFGKLPYTADRHSEICRNWDEHLKQIPYVKQVLQGALHKLPWSRRGLAIRGLLCAGCRAAVFGFQG